MATPPRRPKKGGPVRKKWGAAGKTFARPAVRRRPPVAVAPVPVEPVKKPGLTVVLASKNPGKVAELAALLEGLPLHVAAPETIEKLSPPVEDGRTFAANARKKAVQYSRQLKGKVVIADDSGLEIDALNGQPGIRSARLGGPAASDMDRVRLILQKLEKMPWEKRGARFRCVVAIALNGKILGSFEGAVEGKIAFEPAGSNGFGYDPIFYFPPMSRTFAEMEPIEKNSVSHRHLAMANAALWIRERLASVQPV